MSKIPDCPNSVKGNGCPQSRVEIVNDDDEFWGFRCETCKVYFVVSKDSVRNKSRFENAAKRRQQQMDLERRWEMRKKIFT